MADTFRWTQGTLTGTYLYDMPANWQDLTTPANTGVTFPGTADTAQLIGPLTGPPETVDGPGSAATLDVSGLNILSGTFTTGLTSIDNVGNPASVELQGSLAASQGLTVGALGTGTLTIDAASQVTAASSNGIDELVVGSAAGSSGLIAIQAGGTLKLTGSLQSTSYSLILGNSGSGTIDVTGAGATLDSGGNPFVMSDLAGSSSVMTVSQGGSVTVGTPVNSSSASAAAAIGRAGNATLTVTDPGSSFTANGNMYVGRSGASTLSIENYGNLTAGSGGTFSVGVGNSTTATNIGGTGTATVTTNGTLNDLGLFDLGGNGVSGTVNVNGGGLVKAAGQIRIGVGSTIAGTYYTGNGTLDIGAGGTVELNEVATPGTSGLSAGTSMGSNAVVNVTGAGALLNLENNLLNIGNSGTASVTVSQGGSIEAAAPGSGYAAIVLGNNTGGVGTLTLDGASSATATGPLTVGFNGTGMLALSNGGSLSATNGYIGYNAGSSGGATLSGTGSTLSLSGTLDIGALSPSGAGSLSIGTGAGVVAAIATIGTVGAVTLSGGALSTTSGLTLLAGGGISGFGTLGGAVADNATISASGSLAFTGALSGTGVVDAGASGDAIFQASVAGLGVDFTAVSGRIDIDSPASFAGTVGGFAQGDTMYAAGAASISYTGGSSIALFDNTSTQIGTIALAQAYPANGFVDNGGTITEAPCFAAGTRLDTLERPVPVEALRPGDIVATRRSRDIVPAVVRWTGHRRIDIDRHPHPERVRPVRIAPDAFGPGAPRRALFLSPDHAVFVGGRLIPIRYLVNDTSIVQLSLRTVEYWHVELDRHDILLAEGLPAESYLDTGNRAAFVEAGFGMMLHADFAPRDWGEACAPLCLAGRPIAVLRRRLLARACRLGLAEPARRLRPMAAVATGGAPPRH
ncbi:MAG: Hint domain-containing protein [Acidisphaera sp.]|nr:Hint domain-containing protein [Acidisphaera sp.]